MTSRALVHSALSLRHTGRVPRDLWSLPRAWSRYSRELEQILADFPPDIAGAPNPCQTYPVEQGNPYEPGIYVDSWGCRFTNMMPGAIGEVKEPISTDEDWNDINAVHIPVELLTLDTAKVDAFCLGTDKFVTSGVCPRPFEQLQFIRGTEQFYVDLLQRPPKMLAFIDRMHQFHCELLEKWAKTGVDALNIMDDWGAQRSLLIDPALWAKVFMPLYQDYADIAHRAGKKLFMHSDGYTLDIFPHLIEIGLDAINAQVFCIGLDKVAPFAGQITFWGELDRQHLLPYATPGEIHDAVRAMRASLYAGGGVIAQLEFGVGARPENVRAFYQAWSE